MAYVGRTERLCQAIVANDVDSVKAFLAEEGANPDRRDYTGRTPLQLACMCSTPEVVQCLVDGGARMISRMADGKTALHLAAARGHAEIIRILLTKSNENEEEEAKKEEMLKMNDKSEPSTAEDEDVDMIDQSDAVSHTSASYVKVEAEKEDEEEDLTTYDTLEEDDEPDIYDINVVAWDSRTAPLHLAILHGHTEAVKELVTSFGADILLPVKILNEHNRTPLAAILNLVLIHALPFEKAKEMSQTLLDLGASPAQADLKQKSPLYYLAHSDKFDILDIYMQHDEPAVKRAINHMAVLGTSWTPEYSSALMIALAAKNAPAASKLLGAGAQPEINIGEIVKLITASRGTNNFYDVEDAARSSVKQPIFLAIENDLPLVAIDLLHRGANPNAVIKGKYESKGRTLLDVMRQTLRTLREFLVERKYQSYYHSVATPLDPSDETYLSEFQSGSYKMFTAKDLLRNVRKLNRQTEEQAEKAKAIPDDPPGLVEKKAFIAELVRDYEKLEFIMLQKDAKTWDELHPPQNVPMPIPAQVPTNKPAQLPRMPWKVSFSFDVPAITDNARDGYLQL
jgi:ankyrin repeat protein